MIRLATGEYHDWKSVLIAARVTVMPWNSATATKYERCSTACTMVNSNFTSRPPGEIETALGNNYFAITKELAGGLKPFNGIVSNIRASSTSVKLYI